MLQAGFTKKNSAWFLDGFFSTEEDVERFEGLRAGQIDNDNEDGVEAYKVVELESDEDEDDENGLDDSIV